MTGYNKRKSQVLQYVRENPAATSADLASALDLEIHNARTLLKKYSRQGLLARREADSWGAKTHDITEKGLKRLKWLGGEEVPEAVEEKEMTEDAAQVPTELELQAPADSACEKGPSSLRQFARFPRFLTTSGMTRQYHDG